MDINLVEKQHKKGKLYVEERLQLLFDEQRYTEITKPEERDGVYVCEGLVSGKRVIVAAQDFTFMGGTLGLRHGRFTRPHTGAAALDMPISRSESEGVTEADLLADESLPAADEALLREELARDVRAAVGRLRSEGQRAVVQRCKLEGQSYRQAAAELGCSVGQTYQLFFRASANLARDARLRAAAGIDDSAWRRPGRQKRALHEK